MRTSSKEFSRSRVQSVDALRGLVMIIMALDHARDYIHLNSQTISPEDLTRASAVFFLTRWITHICAPVFMFTAGLGASQYLYKGHSKRELAEFLCSRGIWLLLLEVTVVNFVMTFNFGTSFIMLEVIWALGWCMILLAGLAYLPIRILGIMSVGVILLHNLFDGVKGELFGGLSWLWQVLHQPGILQLDEHKILISYPLIPWVAVMSAGFCFGSILRSEHSVRQRRMIRIGLGLSLGFLLIRALNFYGDPTPWMTQKTLFFTILSFLNTTKYPPSLDYLLMTLGPTLLILAWLDRRQFAKTNPLLVFGRVPLFYFILHIFLIHSIAFLLVVSKYGKAAFYFKSTPTDFGYPLWAVYLLWGSAVVALYPICRWFAQVKQKRNDWWLRYL